MNYSQHSGYNNSWTWVPYSGLYIRDNIKVQEGPRCPMVNGSCKSLMLTIAHVRFTEKPTNTSAYGHYQAVGFREMLPILCQGNK